MPRLAPAGPLQGLFRHLEAVEAQGAGHHHIPAGGRRQGQVAGRQGQGQVVVDAVGRGGAAAVPVIQFRQRQVQKVGDAPDGGGIIDGGSLQGTARVVAHVHGFSCVPGFSR